MTREEKTNKILVLAIDGMDSKLACHYVDEGKMSNAKKD